MRDDLQLAVKHHLVQRLRIAQKIIFQRHHIVVQRLVRTHRVGLAVLGQQRFAKTALGLQLLHLGFEAVRVAHEVFHWNLLRYFFKSWLRPPDMRWRPKRHQTWRFLVTWPCGEARADFRPAAENQSKPVMRKEPVYFFVRLCG